MTEDCDQVARDGVNAALAEIRKHEAECAIYRQKASEDMAAVRRGIEGLYSRFWVAACAVIAILFATCGALVEHTLFGK